MIVMAFASNGVRDPFDRQGEAGFVAWTHVAHGSLEQLLQAG
jgi:hypothetical protein